MAPCVSRPLIAGLSLGVLARATNEGSVCGQDIDCLMKKMTLDEKLHFFAGDLDAIDHMPGVERLGIPEIHMGDGPNGVANTLGGTATSFPCNKAIGDTWDRDLTRKYSNAMAKEFKAKGKNMMLGPGLNLARVPQCGRMDEYVPGDDPTIGSELVKPFVQGARDENVMVSLKHFGNNEQETNRNAWSANPDSNVNMEYYYKPFRAGVEAGASNIMCGYNKVNGLPACKNKDIMQAAKRWGDKFFIVSDWGAIYPDAANGGAADYLNAGVDVEMGAHDDAECTGPDVPATKYGGAGYCNKGDYMLADRMKVLMDQGKVTQARVDETVSRVLGALKTVGLLQNETATSAFPTYEYKDYHSKWFGPITQKDVRTSYSRQVAHEVATKAMVLVQNKDSLLPLKKTSKIEMYGCEGDDVHFHAESGSASGTTPHVPKEPCQSDYASACMFPADGVKAAGGQVVSHKFSDGVNGPQDSEAITVVCLMAKSFNDEGTDRSTLDMQSFPFDKFKKVVVWAIAPGPVILDFAPKVDALLVSSLPGEMGGSALTSILFGTAAPAAHLTMTMPHSMHDTSITVNQDSDNYDEGFEMGYRWYEANNKRPIFGFGWGLSYAKHMQVPSAEFQPPTVAGGKPSVKLNMYREKAGDFDAPADQVVQFYVQHKAPQPRNFKELAGFGKLEGLRPGSSLEAEVELDAPMVWDSKKGEKTAYDRTWVPVGEYDVFVSLHGVEHAKPLCSVKVVDGKYTVERSHDFDKDGSIKFDQDLAVSHQARALPGSAAAPDSEEHQWDEISAAAGVQGKFELEHVELASAARMQLYSAGSFLAIVGSVVAVAARLAGRRAEPEQSASLLREELELEEA